MTIARWDARLLPTQEARSAENYPKGREETVLNEYLPELLSGQLAEPRSRLVRSLGVPLPELIPLMLLALESRLLLAESDCGSASGSVHTLCSSPLPVRVGCCT